jgi:hypothetical protein
MPVLVTAGKLMFILEEDSLKAPAAGWCRALLEVGSGHVLQV